MQCQYVKHPAVFMKFGLLWFQIIGVDFSHIEAKANELVKGEHGLHMQLGQLIDK